MQVKIALGALGASAALLAGTAMPAAATTPVLNTFKMSFTPPKGNGTTTAQAGWFAPGPDPNQVKVTGTLSGATTGCFALTLAGATNLDPKTITTWDTAGSYCGPATSGPINSNIYYVGAAGHNGDVQSRLWGRICYKNSKDGTTQSCGVFILIHGQATADYKPIA